MRRLVGWMRGLGALEIDTSSPIVAPGRSRRLGRRIVLSLTAVLVAVVAQLAMPAAAQAAGSSSFYVSYGASVTSGHINWYSGSIGVVGSVHASSNACVQVEVITDFNGGLLYGNWAYVCAGSKSFEGTQVSIPHSGSTHRAWVRLTVNSAHQRQDYCVSSSGYCTDG